jgi:isoleucyl-tRNA synthetase
VVLDTRLTPELIEEGNVRELVSKWQNMRRDAGYDVTDKIRAGFYRGNGVAGNGELEGVIAKNNAEIASEILAGGIEPSQTPQDIPGGAFQKKYDINGILLEMWVKRV